jgi:hypothetical protein
MRVPVADIVQAVIRVESAFNPRAVSVKRRSGLMQLMPGDGDDVGVRNSLTRQNIDDAASGNSWADRGPLERSAAGAGGVQRGRGRRWSR